MISILHFINNLIMDKYKMLLTFKQFTEFDENLKSSFETLISKLSDELTQSYNLTNEDIQLLAQIVTDPKGKILNIEKVTNLDSYIQRNIIIEDNKEYYLNAVLLMLRLKDETQNKNTETVKYDEINLEDDDVEQFILKSVKESIKRLKQNKLSIDNTNLNIDESNFDEEYSETMSDFDNIEEVEG